MKKALLITAYDRLRYFQEVLFSWHDVRQLDNWHVRISIDPSRWSQHMLEEAEEFVHHRGLTDYQIQVNEKKLGVLEHPYQAIEKLFEEGYEFVVRAEDDLVVSEDILEYFEVAAFRYENTPQIATVSAWSDDDGPDNLIETGKTFSPLVWGTWIDRWWDWIAPTWDHDYSTGMADERGWDWNINREQAKRDLTTVRPRASRVQNIGEFGTHGTPANFVVSPSFERHRQWQKWECR